MNCSFTGRLHFQPYESIGGGNDEIHDFYTRKFGAIQCTGPPLFGLDWNESYLAFAAVNIIVLFIGKLHTIHTGLQISLVNILTRLHILQSCPRIY
jgi:hypothetical protein